MIPAPRPVAIIFTCVEGAVAIATHDGAELDADSTAGYAVMSRRTKVVAEMAAAMARYTVRVRSAREALTSVVPPAT
jgi:hypothetical protein